MALSRREAPSGLHAHGARAAIFGTVSVRSKLPPLHVPMSPSPVSREASRDLWCSIGPSTMGVFKLRTSASAHALCPKISLTIYVQIPLKTNFIFPTLETIRDSSGQWFCPAREEGRRASHKRRQTSLNLARGGKVVGSWPSAWRWRREMRRGQGRRTKDQAGPS